MLILNQKKKLLRTTIVLRFAMVLLAPYCESCLIGRNSTSEGVNNIIFGLVLLKNRKKKRFTELCSKVNLSANSLEVRFVQQLFLFFFELFLLISELLYFFIYY